MGASDCNPIRNKCCLRGLYLKEDPESGDVCPLGRPLGGPRNGDGKGKGVAVPLNPSYEQWLLCVRHRYACRAIRAPPILSQTVVHTGIFNKLNPRSTATEPSRPRRILTYLT